ncbi:hypothetical protein CERSUDRAFT_107279 [Gelatoporia subvermispora B]|uniref:F-box domain-containing protein n=1 Tax=Ceriporiopsis subvermispora (strain B) TaxID=914234 RepID=M2R7J0_CERS8|nr:hypothetical protein CERSUDRAFT_107279 [Gelatoporia subvermispora B]
MGQSTSRVTYGVVPRELNDLTYRHTLNANLAQPDENALTSALSDRTSCLTEVHQSCGKQLPQELWEGIIDHLGSPLDRQSVLSCALVCRAWLPRSRFHLFNTVYLRTPRQIRRLEEVMDEGPHLKPLVTEISLCLDENATKSLFSLPDILSRLPQVKEVNIASFPLYPDGIMLMNKHEVLREPSRRWSRRMWQNATHTATIKRAVFGYCAITTTYSTISTLCICRVALYAFSDLAWVLCALPNLLNLTCSNVTWRVTEYDPLDLEAYRDNVLKRLLVLKLCFCTVDIGLGCLLKAVGTSLQTLLLSVNPAELNEARARYRLNLRRFRSLTSIFLSTWFYSPDSPSVWLPAVLESVTSNNIQFIELSFYCGISLARSQVLDLIPFRRLDEALLRPQLAHAERVSIFFIDDRLNRSYWWAQLAWRMPTLRKNSRISVEIASNPSAEPWAGF